MFININLGNTVEPKPVPAGRYGLTISTAEFRSEKNDIECSIGIDDHLESPNIRHFISLPKKDDDAAKASYKQLMLKRFLIQFNIPFNDTEGFEVADFPGCHAEAQVSLTDPSDSKDGKSVYNRLELDRLPDEESKPVAKSKKA